jgi:uncharacterized protein (DUF58 family)
VIRINKPGYIYILLTILIGFSAVNTANNLLYIVTSTLLAYMLVSGIFGKQNLHRVDVTLELPEERFAGSTVPVAVKLINKRRFMPAFLIRVLILDQEVLFPIVAARSSTQLYLNTVFDHRGRHTLGHVVIASVFPFNFFTRYRKVHKNLEFVVFPRLQRCNLSHIHASQTKWKGDVSSTAHGSDADILSIRDYVFGDPMKYISWKATAKTGRLKTKELSAPESPNVLIDFDRLEKQDLESAISCVAYMVVRLTQFGTAVGLVIDGSKYKPECSSAHKALLLNRLALYGQN